MKLHIPKINDFFSLGLLFMIIKILASDSNFLPYNGVIDTALSCIATIFLFMSVIIEHLTIGETIAYICIVGLGLFTSVRIGNLGLLLSIIACLSARKQPFDKTIELVFYYELIWIAVHTVMAVILSGFGVSMFTSVSGEMKCNFGFGHPNSFSCLIVNLVLMWIWLYYEKITLKHAVIASLIICFFYLFTGTRTALYIVIVLVVLIILCKYFKLKLSWVSGLIVPVLALIVFISISLYHPSNIAMEVINKFLSERIKLGAYWLNATGVTLFGRNLTGMVAEWDEIWRLSGQVTMDNIYSCLIINIGIFWLALIAVSFFVLSRKKNEKINIFIIVWALYGVCEVHGINPFMLFPLFLISLVFNNNQYEGLADKDKLSDYTINSRFNNNKI